MLLTRLVKPMMMALLTGLALTAGPFAWAQTPAHPVPAARTVFLDRVAHSLGVSPSALAKAIQAAQQAEVRDALHSGRITPQRAQILQARIQAGRLKCLGPIPLYGKSAHQAFHRLHAKTAQFLGMSVQAFQTERAQGKSPAQIAQAYGKSIPELQAFLEQDLKTYLQQQVKDGKITAKEAEWVLQAASRHLTRWIQEPGHAPHS